MSEAPEEFSEFHEIGREDEVPPGEIRQYTVEGRPVAVANVSGDLHAFEDICTHQFAHLSEGEFDGERVKCPLHGATFDVKTGEPKSLPAVKPVPMHEVKVEDGDIYVALNPKQVKVGRRRGRR